MIDPNERLTDNTKVPVCLQCKDCVRWGNKGDGDYRSNLFYKVYCDAYEYPNQKPYDVFRDKVKCKYRKTRDGSKENRQ